MTNYVYACAYDGRIKIGVSANVARRMKDIGAHLKKAPELIGFVEAGYEVEKFVHEKLGHFRRKGEWFRDCAEVRECVSTLFRDGPDGIGYVAIAPKKALFIPTPPARENILAARRLIAGWIWPDDAEAGFARLAGVSKEQASSWLRGDEDPPELAMKAFGYEGMMVLMK